MRSVSGWTEHIRTRPVSTACRGLQITGADASGLCLNLWRATSAQRVYLVVSMLAGPLAGGAIV